MHAADTQIRAVLGPTNTGKTHYAIERMLAHPTGMIGFPLRLLARENYERIARIKGESAVGLITGEEKIVPDHPRYFICTVESMPVERRVSFLAVDEIQLCADPERGHVFTDRLLNARGEHETLFLGAETIAPLIQRHIRGIDILNRTRMSTLTYGGYRKLTKLPRRTAVVAFSAAEVYQMAELIRRHRGGTAVVMGALSPRTRNAQVELFQNGEVDFLVATDAIGMGLNMDIDHVAFARLEKFDGRHLRRLNHAEIGQIAGRAGRHMSDGSFGVTGDIRELPEEAVSAVEAHDFDTVKALTWRNSALDFGSPEALLRSLEQKPPDGSLMRVRNAHDTQALKALRRDADLMRLTPDEPAVRLLWDICQIPDFRKTLSDAHIRLIGDIYRHLRTAGRLPESWVSGQIYRLDREDGDIDTLMQRLAHVRTWTYVAHRANWLDEPSHWQERSRAIEDRISDALHEKLTQRFVDRRSAILVRSLLDGVDLLAGVKKDGSVIVEGQHVGTLDGFRFTPDFAENGDDAKALMTAARKALKEEIAARVSRLEKDDDKLFRLLPDGQILWRGDGVAKLAKGKTPLEPKVAILRSDLLDGDAVQRIGTRLADWLDAHIKTALEPLFSARDAQLKGTGRGIAYQLIERLGIVPRSQLGKLIKPLDKSERQALNRAGIRLGPHYVFVRNLTKPAEVEMKALLWSVWSEMESVPDLPPPGRVSVKADESMPRDLFEVIGYPIVGPLAVRVDMLDRLVSDMYANSQDGVFPRQASYAPLVGASLEELDQILEALGFERVEIPAPDPQGGELANGAEPASVEEAALAHAAAVEAPAQPDEAGTVATETAAITATAQAQPSTPSAEAAADEDPPAITDIPPEGAEAPAQAGHAGAAAEDGTGKAGQSTSSDTGEEPAAAAPAEPQATMVAYRLLPRAKPQKPKGRGKPSEDGETAAARGKRPLQLGKQGGGEEGRPKRQVEVVTKRSRGRNAAAKGANKAETGAKPDVKAGLKGRNGPGGDKKRDYKDRQTLQSGENSPFAKLKDIVK